MGFSTSASGEDRFHLVKKSLVDSWDWLEEEFGDYAKSSLVKSVQDLLSGLAKFLLFNRDPVDLFETLWESCSELVLEICCHVKEGVLEKSLERAWERGEECCPGEWTKLREFPVFSR